MAFFRKKNASFTEGDKEKIIDYWVKQYDFETDSLKRDLIWKYIEKLRKSRFRSFNEYKAFVFRNNPYGA